MGYCETFQENKTGWCWDEDEKIVQSIRYIAANIDQSRKNIIKAVEGLDDKGLWLRMNTNTAAIGNLLMHIAGTEHDWIGHKLGGLPLNRSRNNEFSTRGGLTLEELVDQIKRVGEESTAVLRTLTEEAVNNTIIEGKFSIPFILHFTAQHLAGHCMQIEIIREYMDDNFAMYK